MRLSSYVAHAGICSRRKSAELVKQGHVVVNNITCTEPWYVVKAGDVIQVNGRVISPQKKITEKGTKDKRLKENPPSLKPKKIKVKPGIKLGTRAKYGCQKETVN